MDNKLGKQVLKTIVIVCPNSNCREASITAYLGSYTDVIGGFGTKEKDEPPHSVWPLRPQAKIKIYPDYVPEVIIKDYQEACLIKNFSPKASATLSRRCLQGMIRGVWDVKKNRLVDEIDALKNKIDALSWEAIDSIRHIGNIGAHMEKDINLILEVEPKEAELLIGLIETLITEWYVNKHEREARMNKIIEVAKNKI
ncbi:MAG: DUF4145 domain-containing protein [Candidatus Edwardsbacteria bacterium]|nr:DUF4145 domain-containing protein [Candidatus Edwardsbacteria bacterium]MBU1576370.1 DUF4145 domain-containing protein [Candidatus Edwardsbacteria bacterium]MBU2463212.1 DUF4145 domain-containing protein [Candidatus Edwardsbacteria bacterium]MBU2593547.1 DUF4145 domain-containing protein [Candidatus Edwardsbacteria bacterium]